MKRLIMLMTFFCFFLYASPQDEAIQKLNSVDTFQTDIVSTVYYDNDRDKEKKVKKYVKRFQENFPAETYDALENLFHMANITLNSYGHYELAREIKSGWNRNKFEMRAFLFKNKADRYIGEFEPLSKWLADAYDKIEGAIGKTICDITRLSDLKTFNFCIPVIFSPCSGPWKKSDYVEHFASDGKYHGLSPVVLYWVSYAGCGGLTFGAGLFFVCMPAARVLEYLYENSYAVPLGQRIYDQFCGGN